MTALSQKVAYQHGTPKEARKVEAGNNNFLPTALRDGGKTNLILHLGKNNKEKPNSQKGP